MPVRRNLDAREETLAALAWELPDLPRWVETRGLLLSGRGAVLRGASSGGGYLVQSPDARLVCAVSDPDRALLRDAAAALAPGAVILGPPESRDALVRALPDWTPSWAVLHTRSVPVEPPAAPPDAEVRILARNEQERLRLLPGALREEIAEALSWSHVCAALVGGLAVSVACVAHETETLWDVSIDTLETHRRRGLGAICVEALADHMEKHGRLPVWGALEGNDASLWMAARRGFTPVDRLAILTR